VRTLKASLVALFPESHRSITEASILGRARSKGIFALDEVQVREFATDKHRTVDDNPAGGGPGMVMKVDVLARAIDDAVTRDRALGESRTRRIVLLDAAGARFTQKDAMRFAAFDHLVLVCGRYEGVDARVHAYVDEIVSIGDYVLTGGELGALVILDATVRVLDGALGNPESAVVESHTTGILEHRQYTRPVDFEGARIPPVLMSGDHQKIARARRKDALLRTRALRPDLLLGCELARADQKILDDARVPALDVERTEPVSGRAVGAPPGAPFEPPGDT
jgi:tRNA (guanine37-N1)-methyltransferase